MNKYQEALEHINCYCSNYHTLSNDLDTLQELVDKETPKKVITDGSIYGGTCDKVQYICPKCKQIMLRQVCTTAHKPNYCYKCGHALDWSENE